MHSMSKCSELGDPDPRAGGHRLHPIVLAYGCHHFVRCVSSEGTPAWPSGRRGGRRTGGLSPGALRTGGEGLAVGGIAEV